MAEGGEQQGGGGGLLMWGSCGCAFLAAIIALLFMFFVLGLVGENTTGGSPQEQTGGGAGGGEGPIEGSCAEQLVKKGSKTDFGKNNTKAIIDKVNEAQAKFGGDAALMLAQLQAESNFYPKAVSNVGAQGIAQFMPGTWATQGQDGNGNDKKDPFEWEDGIYTQAAYNKYIRNFLGSLGTPENIIASYNAGEGAVKQYGGIPPYPETQNYVKNIMAFYQEYKKCLSGGGDSIGAIVKDDYAFPTVPISKIPEGHHDYPAVDLPVDNGTKLIAITNGKIIDAYKTAAEGGSCGIGFILQGDDKRQYTYCHMQSLSISGGQVIKAGESVGYSDSTGHSSGPHLHLQIRENGKLIWPQQLLRQLVK